MPRQLLGRRLDQPRAGRGSRPRGMPEDREMLGRLSESIARFLGTGRFIAIQTVLVVVWISLNLLAPALRWDPYPFILLNLAFSTQSAYAAPLILLAQNRQDDRDRVSLREDRARAERTQADAEFLAREVADLHLAVNQAATREFIAAEFARILRAQQS